MICCKCDSNRLMSISAKSNDLNDIEVPHLNISHDGYVPSMDGIGRGDYVGITFCLDCGQIQGFKSYTDRQLLNIFNGRYEDDEYD